LNLSTNTSPFGANTGELLGVSPKIDNTQSLIKREEEPEKGITTEILISKKDGQQDRDNMTMIPASSSTAAVHGSNNLTGLPYSKIKTKTKKF